jgi:hypothetical protein
MSKESDCRQPGEHNLHMCMVSVKGLKAEVAREMFGEPKFACANCGAKANLEKYLCRPKPL